MRHERSPAMTRARRKARQALDELRYAPRYGVSAERVRQPTSTQIRYCTATTADKPFGEVSYLIRSRGLGALSQQEKACQT
jgi:hypothetical protein